MAAELLSGIELKMTFEAINPKSQCRGTFERTVGDIEFRFYHVPSRCRCVGGPTQALAGPMLGALLTKINRWFDDGPCDDLETVIIVFLKNVLRCPLRRELRAKQPPPAEMQELNKEDWDELRLSRAVCTMSTEPTNGTSAVDEVQTVQRNGQEYTEVKEGLARILVPFSAKESADKTLKNVEEQQKVFYNPIQQFNRDLTVLAIKAYGEEVLSKSRSANAEHVAKRKRDKSDGSDRNPKKQEKEPTDAEGKDAQDEVAPTVGGDTVMTDVHNGHGTDHNDSAATAANVSTEETSTANEPLNPSGTSKDEESKSNEAKQDNQPRGPKFTILDALSATGLRALRYAQELPFVTSVTANDLTPSAVEAIRLNAEHNGVESRVNAIQGDARAHMYSIAAEEVTRDHVRDKHPKKGRSRAGKRYDVIDLDPYGTAATFFEAAINALRDDGGLLCVTCTDSGVWASHGYSEKTFALYGGIPVKGFYSHEAGLRLILHGIATTAARYGLAIEPLLSLSIDYYIRVFVKVKKSPAHVKFLAGKTMVVYTCDQGCGAWETQLLLRNKKISNKSGKNVFYKHGLAMAPTANEHCEHCGSKTHLAGPMYAGPLHSPDFIKKILDDLPTVSADVYGTKARIEGMLQTALEEFLSPPKDDQPSIKEDELAAVEPYPFFFHPSILSGVIHCICPDEDSFRGALRHLGYEVTRSHCKPGSLKTNAPWKVIWHIMREWVRQGRPVNVDKITETSPAYSLLRLGKKADATDDEIDKLEVIFDQKLGQDRSKKGLIRYQANPRENWGPLSKAKGH
ncbi:dimethylguanosine tRNA methyltransferase [Biscogniauxia marginata]|nr:dimethylguanosine tRNA methyltransferase [Biscogniauxia marginata]